MEQATAAQLPEVFASLEDLERQVIRSVEIIEKLTERLLPITKQPSSDKGLDAAPSDKVEVARRIDAQKDIVSDYADKILNLMDRMEI